MPDGAVTRRLVRRPGTGGAMASVGARTVGSGLGGRGPGTSRRHRDREPRQDARRTSRRTTRAGTGRLRRKGKHGCGPSVHNTITIVESQVHHAKSARPPGGVAEAARWPVSQPPRARGAGALIGPAGVQQVRGDVFTRHPQRVHYPADIRPKAFTFRTNVFTFRVDVFTVDGEALVAPTPRHGPDLSHRRRSGVRIIARRIRHPLECRVIRSDHQRRPRGHVHRV